MMEQSWEGVLFPVYVGKRNAANAAMTALRPECPFRCAVYIGRLLALPGEEHRHRKAWRAAERGFSGNEPTLRWLDKEERAQIDATIALLFA